MARGILIVGCGKKSENETENPDKKKKFDKKANFQTNGVKNFKSTKGKKDGKPFGKFDKNNDKPFSKDGKPFGKFNNKNGKPFSKDGKFSNDQTKPGEKPKWSEMKKEKKQLRLVRRKAKATAEVFEISHKAKLLAAQIQRKVVKADFKEKSCRELHGLLKEQYKSIALTHDLSRVIQVLLKYGPEDIKTEITEELLDLTNRYIFYPSGSKIKS